MHFEEEAKIERLLVRYDENRSLSKVVQWECRAATKTGDNYTSDMIRVTMRVLLGSGEVMDKSIILKRVPKDEGKKTLNQDFLLFENEIKVYTKFLPEMVRLMRECGDKRNPLWCECLGILGEKDLILQDLQELGFHNVNRHNGQDLNQAIMVLRSIGRFHVMSRVLSKRGVLNLLSLPPYILIRDNPVVDKLYSGAIYTLIQVMKESWGPEWSPYVSKLEKLKAEFGGKLKELGENEANFNVLNHGDCWNNNILFKFDPDTKAPSEVRFVDFQICHYNSFGFDLTYYLYSSLDPQRRKVEMSNLLETYRVSLVTSLEIMGESAEEVPSLVEIEAEMDRLGVMALLVELSVLPIVLAPPDNPFDVQKLYDGGPSGPYNKDMFQHKGYVETIKDELVRFAKLGII